MDTLTNKKRKTEIKIEPQNSLPSTTLTAPSLTPEDFRKIFSQLSLDQLHTLLATAATTHPDVLESIRNIANIDATQRKLFIRGLGWDTTSDNLRALFSQYGPLEEAIVILDKVTGKSKGYGFVIFKNVDGAVLALNEPSKKIDGRMTVAQLASAGVVPGGPVPGVVDVASRKVFVGNVPVDMAADRLLAHFSTYGEIEEGPLGYDKVTEKSKGYAMFVYKTLEGAQASLVEPMKIVDGCSLVCRLANNDSYKKGLNGKLPVSGVGNVQTLAGAGNPVGNVGEGGGGMHQGPGMPGSYGGHALGYGTLQGGYGPPGVVSAGMLGGYSGASGQYGQQPGSYGGMPMGLGGLSGMQGQAAMMAQHQQQMNAAQQHHQQHLNAALQSSFGAAGLSSVPSSLGAGAGYASGLGGSYSGLGQAPASAGAGYGAAVGVGYGAAASGGYGVFSGLGSSSLYKTPAAEAGLPSSGYPENGSLGGLTASTFPGHLHQPLGASSNGAQVPLPPGRMYANLSAHY